MQDMWNLSNHLPHEQQAEVGSALSELSWEPPSYSLPVSEWDSGRFYAIRRDWYRRLCLLRCGSGSSYFPTTCQVAAFTSYLIEAQRLDLEQKGFWGSWTIPADTRMPADARMDFAYFPTYIAVAWLVLVRQRYPYMWHMVGRFDHVIRRGLRFAAGRKLQGHGYDSSHDLLAAVRVLALGNVFSYVRERPLTNSQFMAVIEEVEDKLINHLPTHTGWGAASAAEQQHALALIRAGDKDDNRVCTPVWSMLHEHDTSWYLRQVIDVATPLIAGAALQAVKEEIASRADEFQSLFDEIKPQYRVFGRGRQVKSALLPILTTIDPASQLRVAIAKTGRPEWANSLSDQEILTNVGRKLVDGVATELESKIKNSQYLSGREYSLRFKGGRVSQEGYLSLKCQVIGPV